MRRSFKMKCPYCKKKIFEKELAMMAVNKEILRRMEKLADSPERELLFKAFKLSRGIA